MVNAANEALDLKEVAKRLGKFDGRRVGIPTIRKWIARGHKGVRLIGKRKGHRWHVLPSDLDAFINALNPAASEDPAFTQARTRNGSDAREDAKVDQLLDQAGCSRGKKRTMRGLPAIGS